MAIHWQLYLGVLLLSTFTGWAVAWIATRILFYPKKPVTILGYQLQGILPKNQTEIALQLGLLVSQELLSFKDIEQKIANPDTFQKLKPEIENHIDHFLRHKLKEVFPMLSMLIGDKTINQLKGAFLIELESLFPVLMTNYMATMQQDLNLEAIVREKVAGFSLDKIEALLIATAGKQFSHFRTLGVVIGIIIGLVQILLIMVLL